MTISGDFRRQRLKEQFINKNAVFIFATDRTQLANNAFFLSKGDDNYCQTGGLGIRSSTVGVQ